MNRKGGVNAKFVSIHYMDRTRVFQISDKVKKTRDANMLKEDYIILDVHMPT